MMSSKVFSAVVNPSFTARLASKLRGQPSTIPVINGSGSRLIRPATFSPATRFNAAISSPTVAERPGMVRLRRAPAAAGKTARIQQDASAVEVDAIALVEIEPGLAGDDRRQMENHVGPIRDQLFGDAGHREITRHRIDRKSRFVGLRGSNHVLQRHAGDIALAETSIAQKHAG